MVAGGDFDADAPSVRGVVAADGSEALYAVVTPALSADSRRRVLLPGLDPGRRYRLEVAQPASLGPAWLIPRWLCTAPALGEGSPDSPTFARDLLAHVGLDLPTFHPEAVVIIHAVAVA